MNGSQAPSDKDNLETFSLFWLDAAVNTSSENVQVQSKLRSVINHLKTFDNIQTCERYIRALPKEDRLVLIISGGFGRELVPRIVGLQQVFAIYVFCYDKKGNKEWSQQFDKVKLVTTDLQQLMETLSSHRQPRQKRYDEPITFSIADRSTGAIDGTFLNLQLLVDVLIRMEPLETEMEELYCFLAPFYGGNETELNILKEFKKDYRPNKALWWYSRDSCIYRLMNKALRTQNSRVLLIFRFLMRDLRQQLAQYQCAQPVLAYRGQVMSGEELKLLKQSTEKLISVNSFLSTSLDRKVTLTFLKPVTGLERVLFEIEADPNLVRKKPFANIREFSYFKEEEEILFMPGSIFRTKEVKCDNDGVWSVRLVMCADDDHDLKTLFEHMNKEYYHEDLSLLSFGDVLRRMGKFDDAETYYNWYLAELPPNSPKVANCYQSLGQVAQDKGNYKASLESYGKALRLYETQQNAAKIADTYSGMGLTYYHQYQFGPALDVFNRALGIYRQLYGDDHPQSAICFDRMGAIYGQLENFNEALKYKARALIIWHKHLPADHPDLGQSHTCIGNTHSCIGQYDLAMKNFNQSLSIYRMSLPDAHPRVAMTLKNMGVVHERKGEIKEALDFYEKAARIYRHVLAADHADVLEIEATIKRLSK